MVAKALSVSFPRRCQGGGNPRRQASLSQGLLTGAGRLECVGRRVAGNLTRLQQAHRWLREEIALEVGQIAETRPGFETEVAATRQAPKRQVRKILCLQSDCRAIRRFEMQAP